MNRPVISDAAQTMTRPDGWSGIVSDWSSDQRTFKNVPWGKAMMWIFLLSDTFIFSCFLLSYMTVQKLDHDTVAQSERSLLAAYRRLRTFR